MEKEKDTLPEVKNENNPEDEEEDLLYTHKPENRGNSMQWNNAFCRRPGHCENVESTQTSYLILDLSACKHKICNTKIRNNLIRNSSQLRFF